MRKKKSPFLFFFFLGLYYSISLQSLTGLERGLLLLTGFVEIWQRKKTLLNDLAPKVSIVIVILATGVPELARQCLRLC